MRVFLDTNILVSAVATRGLCADVMREVLISHQLIVSTDLLGELENVLHDKLNLPHNLISEFLEIVQRDSLFAKSSDLGDINIQDRNDVPILSAALNGGAELFVTGDKELLELKKVGAMEIVSPRVFWKRLKTQPPDECGEDGVRS